METRGDLGTRLPGPDVSGDTVLAMSSPPGHPAFGPWENPTPGRGNGTLLPSVCGGRRESTTAHTLLCHLHCPPSQAPGREPAGVSTHSAQSRHEESGLTVGFVLVCQPWLTTTLECVITQQMCPWIRAQGSPPLHPEPGSRQHQVRLGENPQGPGTWSRAQCSPSISAKRSPSPPGVTGKVNKDGRPAPLVQRGVLRHKPQRVLGLLCPREARQGGQCREGEDQMSLSQGHWNLDLDARSLLGDGIILPCEQWKQRGTGIQNEIKSKWLSFLLVLGRHPGPHKPGNCATAELRLLSLSPRFSLQSARRWKRS